MKEEDAHSLHHSSYSNSTSRNATTDTTTDGTGSSHGARYRLMSPAKLPISRSTCITIPPGLSPTSFLESPVLLSNMKGEPSPTTGSFFKPQLMQGSTDKAAVPSGNLGSSSNNAEERTSSSFEFRFQTGASSALGFPSGRGRQVPLELNRNGPGIHQDQRFSQPSVLSSLGPQSGAMVKHESSASSAVDELNEGGQSSAGIQASPSENKDSTSSVSAERTSDDGYNWRKYGQKLVKGSEFPRSYYKCTFPNCEVKKIFERSPSGQITEIVYKGSHDHPKPQAARRQNHGALMSIQEDPSLTAHEVLPSLQSNEDNADGSGSQLLGHSDDVDEDDPLQKRRKMEDSIDVTPIVQPIREPRVVVQTLSEVDILDDGYRWRKYGQKVVRGNPNPRSYYKCTNAGCPVRKHVERASHDPKAVITTYEGKHNHDVPTAKNSSREFAVNAPYNGISKIRPEENNGSISLNLGVGIGHGVENGNNENMHLDGGAARNQNVLHQSGMMLVQASQAPACYSTLNGGGMHLYGNRENHAEGHSFQAPTLHPSNQCPQTLGRILMGP